MRRVDHQRRIAHRRGADDDAVDALGQPAFHRRHVAHAAAELHRNADGFENAVDRAGVHRLAGKGAVEIDDVQIFKARQFESARLRRRIAVKHGGARHVALLQAHGQSFFEIDGGKKDHGAHFKKFAISFKPQPLALLRVELRADHVVAPDDGRERAAVIGLRHQIAALRGFSSNECTK